MKSQPAPASGLPYKDYYHYCATRARAAAGRDRVSIWASDVAAGGGGRESGRQHPAGHAVKARPIVPFTSCSSLTGSWGASKSLDAALLYEYYCSRWYYVFATSHHQLWGPLGTTSTRPVRDVCSSGTPSPKCHDALLACRGRSGSISSGNHAALGIASSRSDGGHDHNARHARPETPSTSAKPAQAPQVQA